MNLQYPHIPQNILLELLEEPEFAKSLAYLVDFKNHGKLNIIPRTNSIEVSNYDITIIVVLYSGFEKHEYYELKQFKNVHLICFSDVLSQMLEFENMHIKVIDKLAWLFSIIGRSDEDYIRKLNRLKQLRID